MFWNLHSFNIMHDIAWLYHYYKIIFPLLTCAKIIHSLRTVQYIKLNFQHHKALQGTNWHLPSPWHRCYSAWSRPRNPFSPWTFLTQQSSCEILTHGWVEAGGSWWQLPGTALGLPTEFSAWHWNWSVCVFLWGIPDTESPFLEA